MPRSGTTCVNRYYSHSKLTAQVSLIICRDVVWGIYTPDQKGLENLKINCSEKIRLKKKRISEILGSWTKNVDIFVIKCPTIMCL